MDPERIEKIFDQIFIELAGLSDGVEEFQEIQETIDLYDPLFVTETKGLLSRYDNIAARARDNFTRLRKELLQECSSK